MAQCLQIAFKLWKVKKKVESIIFETNYKIPLWKLYTKYNASVKVNDANKIKKKKNSYC